MNLSHLITLLQTAKGIDDGAVLGASSEATAACEAVDPVLTAHGQGTASAALSAGLAMDPKSGSPLGVAVTRALAYYYQIDVSGGVNE